MAGVLHIELGLKLWIYVLRWLGVVSDCTGIRVENNNRYARYKQYTHMGIPYAHPSHHTLQKYAMYVIPARSRQNDAIIIVIINDNL